MAQSQTDYDSWEVTSERQTSNLGSSTMWKVERKGDTGSIEVNTGKDGKKLARTLAAALDKASVLGIDDIMPPSLHPSKHEGDEWEEWVADRDAVPVEIAAAGKAPIAAWLKVVHREREGWIANRIGVSEATVRQYLSDLREGRR